MGSIRKKGDVYCIRYHDRLGRQREESAHTSDYDTAKRLLRDKEGLLAKGVPVTPKIGQYTFEQACAAIRADYQLQGRDSLPDLNRRIDLHLAPHFAGRRMATITASDWRTYQLARNEAGAANAQINREQAALLRMFNLAVRDGRLLHVPVLARLKEPTGRIGFFERDQFDAVRRHLAPPLQVLATVAYITGWRVTAELLP